MATAPTSPARSTAPGPIDAGLGRTHRDQVAAFRPAILGIRGGTTAISVALAAPSFATKDWWIIAWCAVVVAYNVFRIVQPLRYLDDVASIARVLVEVGLHVIVVAATGFWDSPFVFALITAVM
ncbi:hypothetical protein, partial [Campylobacter jejuni]|uniref:hypothetical protein n=1 Tax=Campylobacter jejuni TaxID=197 RepID=UPI00211CB742